jgi:23S rRNA G2445 N2-methylase RlmL
MAHYIAQTSRGLSDILEREVKALGLNVVSKSSIGVMFETDLEGMYRANLCLRTATRIIKTIHEFKARTAEDLYNGVRKHDFTQYISVKDAFALDVTSRGEYFKDQRFVTLKMKDGIADQFREKYDERPDVDADNPDLLLMVRVVDDNVSVAIDTSGETLTRRGYRLMQGEAPIREHLAAGLIELTDWNETDVIYDPMCGSGTIPIEAALRARKIAPGTFRKKFAFQKSMDFDDAIWQKVVNQTLGEETEPLPLKLYGSDVQGKMIKIAKENAERAGVEGDIHFSSKHINEIEPPAERGLLIVNPPYGDRLGVTEDLKDVYKDLAHVLKTKFSGWTLWLISGNDELTAALKLKATRKIQVYNGNIDCRFLQYKIN